MKKVIECKTGEECISYKNYLLTEHWKNTKERFYKTKKNKSCKICDSKKRLNVHHKTYTNIGKELMRDLVCLCESCHEDVHYEIEIGNSYFTIHENDVIIKRLRAECLALKRLKIRRKKKKK